MAVAGSPNKLKIVPDAIVKTFPYQSVGKLFYVKAGPSGRRDSFATAWVPEIFPRLPVVITTAHCLKMGTERAEKILFEPGFIPFSKPTFGKYHQIPGGEGEAWFVHPKWDPDNIEAKYDFGMIRLDKDPTTGKYVDEVVKPIQLFANHISRSTSAWNTIGYAVRSSKNPDGRMVEQTGEFYELSIDGGSVYKYGTLPKGTSGGPWILAGSQHSSNGIQAGNSGDYAVSPYFTTTAKDLVEFFNLGFVQSD